MNKYTGNDLSYDRFSYLDCALFPAFFSTDTHTHTPRGEKDSRINNVIPRLNFFNKDVLLLFPDFLTVSRTYLECICCGAGFCGTAIFIDPLYQKLII